ECLDRLIPFGEGHFRRAVAECVAHYHRERNHQGLSNELIEGPPMHSGIGRVRRRQPLGALPCVTESPCLWSDWTSWCMVPISAARGPVQERLDMTPAVSIAHAFTIRPQ